VPACPAGLRSERGDRRMKAEYEIKSGDLDQLRRLLALPAVVTAVLLACVTVGMLLTVWLLRAHSTLVRTVLLPLWASLLALAAVALGPSLAVRGYWKLSNLCRAEPETRVAIEAGQDGLVITDELGPALIPWEGLHLTVQSKGAVYFFTRPLRPSRKLLEIQAIPSRAFPGEGQSACFVEAVNKARRQARQNRARDSRP
jgi:hypothetical protein